MSTSTDGKLNFLHTLQALYGGSPRRRTCKQMAAALRATHSRAGVGAYSARTTLPRRARSHCTFATQQPGSNGSGDEPELNLPEDVDQSIDDDFFTPEFKVRFCSNQPVVPPKQHAASARIGMRILCIHWPAQLILPGLHKNAAPSISTGGFTRRADAQSWRTV